jgi:hypothetical protein
MTGHRFLVSWFCLLHESEDSLRRLCRCVVAGEEKSLTILLSVLIIEQTMAHIGLVEDDRYTPPRQSS